MALFLTFVLSMMLTLVLIPPLMKSAMRFNIVDIPNERKIHTGNIPRIGGLAMIISVILPVLVLLSRQVDVTYLYAALGILLVFGILDDRFQLNYKLKFLGQFTAILIAVWFGGVVIHNMPLWPDGTVSMYFTIPFTIFALLGVTNATNLSDGLDGLAGGLSLLSFAGIGLIAYTQENIVVLSISIAVMGSILGFLRFNTYPARIFMGDTGSQFLGFTLGIAVILLTQHTDSIMSTAIPLFLLGLPILDTLTVIVSRLVQRRSPFRPDKNHIHHRLLTLGFHHTEAVMIIYVIQFLMVITGYLLRYESNIVVLSCYLISCIFILGLLHLARVYDWNVHTKLHVGEKTLIEKKFNWLKDNNKMLNMVLLGTASLLGVFFLTAVSFAESLPEDSYVLIFVMITVFSGLFFFRSRTIISWMERVIIYTLAAIVIFIIQEHSSLSSDFFHYQNLIYVLLVVSVILGFRYSNLKDFGPTPLDFLVILAAIVSSVLPELQFISEDLGLNITRLIVLFYALEFILVHIGGRLDILRYTVFITLGILGLNGVF